LERLIKEGKVTYKITYGLANLESKTPITDSTAFNIIALVSSLPLSSLF